jgi:hypothetical protein
MEGRKNRREELIQHRGLPLDSNQSNAKHFSGRNSTIERPRGCTRKILMAMAIPIPARGDSSNSESLAFCSHGRSGVQRIP